MHTLSWLTEKLSTLMHERSETVDSLSRTLGLERSRLNNILKGSATPNDNLVKRLARHFGEDSGEWLLRTGRSESDNRTAIDLPSDFTRVAAVSEIPDGEMKIVFNDLVVVARVQGRLHAFGNVCPHAAGPIGEGFLEDSVVECPWHAGQWDIATGRALNPLATADIPVFDVRVVGEHIEVRVTPAVFSQRVGAGNGPGSQSTSRLGPGPS